MSQKSKKRSPVILALLIALGLVASVATAQQKPPAGAPPAAAVQKPTTPPVLAAPAGPAQVALPPDFVLGPDDVLHVEFWRDKELSADVTVRPDGKITLPVLNDVQAAGLTPDQFRDKVLEQAKRFIEDPQVTITVKEIKSRKVFITGEVNKGGTYLLNDRMTVLQLIAAAGGLTEFAKSKNIIIMRPDAGGGVRPAGQAITFKFNYKDVLAGKNLKQNIELKPGDTVIVP
jgi:polysaccharide export outer membrane protein